MFLYESAKLGALRSLLPSVPRALRALVPHVSRALRAFVCHMHRALRTLVPHLPHASLASLTSYLKCSTVDHYEMQLIRKECCYFIISDIAKHLR